MSLPNDDQEPSPKLRLGNPDPVRTPPPPPPTAAKPIPPTPAGPTSPPPLLPTPKATTPPGPGAAVKPTIPPAVAPTPKTDAPEKTDRPRSISIALAIGTLVILLLIISGSVYWLFLSPDSEDTPSRPVQTASIVNPPETSPTLPPESLGNALETASEISPEAAAATRGIREDNELVETLSDSSIPPPELAESHSNPEIVLAASDATSGEKNIFSPPTLPNSSETSPESPVSTINFSSQLSTGATAPTFVEMDPELSAFIETAAIAGILPDGNDSRAIINGNLYLVGDNIAETDLQFVATNAYQLVFQDSRGAIYRRNF